MNMMITEEELKQHNTKVIVQQANPLQNLNTNIQKINIQPNQSQEPTQKQMK